MASPSEPVNGCARPCRATSSKDQYDWAAGNGRLGSPIVRMCAAGTLTARSKIVFGAGTYKYRRYEASAVRSIVRSNFGPAISALSSEPNVMYPGSWYTYSG